MILGIDHILIAVEDLQLAIETYQALGFEVLAGGQHPKMGTQNALVPLADGTYLELISVVAPALAESEAPHVTTALAHENRLAAFALESNDLAADVSAVRGRGFELNEPHEGARERPDGQHVAWRSAHAPDWHYPFLIQDSTPRPLRISPPTSGIGRTLRMGDVNVGVRDLASASVAYQKLLGMEGEDGWFELARGAIILKDVDIERVLQVVLEADNPLEIVQAWQDANVPFDQNVIGGVGITLEPQNTLGAPLALTGRMS